jgi:hypothetical protein
MFLATINPPKQLLYVSYIGRVQVQELVQGRENILLLLADLKPGFRVLSDLGQVESFGVNCAGEIGETMKIFSQKGIALVVRVIPDPTKDFGLNILSLFHYHHGLRVVTCSTMTEAMQALSL